MVLRSAVKVLGKLRYLLRRPAVVQHRRIRRRLLEVESRQGYQISNSIPFISFRRLHYYVCVLKTNVVELLCASCDGPVSRGQRLGFPIYAAMKLAALSSSSQGNLLNQPLQLTLPLLESAGWLRDPQNVLLPWTAPTQCELIQVLFTGLKILAYLYLKLKIIN